MKKIYFFFLLFLILFLISSFGSAKTSTATVDIKNSKPLVQLIATDLVENDLDIRIQVVDFNGYENIKSVEIKIVLVDGEEQVYEKFGQNYQKSNFATGQNIEAIYNYHWLMDQNDLQGAYRVKVRVSDDIDSTESFSDFNFPQKFGGPVGAFIRNTGEDGMFVDFFKGLLNSVIGWFS